MGRARGSVRRILLDTHIFVSALSDPARLNSDCWKVLNDPDGELFLSIASAWELAIKAGLGKISLPRKVRSFVAEGCRAANISLVGIDLAHLDELERLPLHHRDPFDRLLVAQAQLEELVLITNDEMLSAYDVSVLWR